jgi:prepilin-type N-terminal cleavage/methylation domain-containing protein
MPQTKKHTISGFTLVEIMIAIVIIILLSQLGNMSSLFQSKEKSQVEEISVNVINVIDEVKTHALLGKTEDSKIVRKRRIKISLSGNTISYASSYNLAENPEDTYTDLTSKDWFLQELNGALYECIGDTATKLPGTEINMLFEDENIKFQNGTN